MMVHSDAAEGVCSPRTLCVVLVLLLLLFLARPRQP